MTDHRSDLVILGGGSGGYAAALRAAELGKSVVIVERDKLGGTCLHRGCIPTKALLHAAEVADHVRDAASVGIAARWEGVDVAALTQYRESIVAKKFSGLTGLVAARGITVVSGDGTLVPVENGDGAGLGVRVGEDTYVGTDVILATGSVTRELPIAQSGGRILTSETALQLGEVPRRVIVLGGGVIGVEFASVWRSLGAEVTIIEALERLVPAEEPSSTKALTRAFGKRGITVMTATRVAGAADLNDRAVVSLESGEDLEADYVLVAVGRAPATAELGLDELGVATERGFVTVDARLQTTLPHVWAVGDIVAGLQLAHRGFQQGFFVAETIAGLEPIVVPESSIPRVTYSNPELASVGLTEADARAAHGDAIVTYEYNLAGNAKSEILGTAGIVKVVRISDGPVVGVHMAGDRVGELITQAQLIVGWEAHPDDVAPYIFAHPTQSEALGEALLALAGKPLHTR